MFVHPIRAICLFVVVALGQIQAKTSIVNSKGNILFFHHIGTKSHLIALSSLAEGLARHGYNVTSVFWTKMSTTNMTNYKQYVITDRYSMHVVSAK